MRFVLFLLLVLFAFQGNVLTFTIPDNLILVDDQIEEYYETELEKLEVVQNAYFSSTIKLVKMGSLGNALSEESEAISAIQNALFNSFEYYSLSFDECLKLAQDFYALFQDDFDFYDVTESCLSFEVCFVLKHEDEYSGKRSLAMLPKGQRKNNNQAPVWVFVARSKLVD